MISGDYGDCGDWPRTKSNDDWCTETERPAGGAKCVRAAAACRGGADDFLPATSRTTSGSSHAGLPTCYTSHVLARVHAPQAANCCISPT